MSRSKAVLVTILVLGVVVLAGCAAGGNDVSNVDQAVVAGFWRGLWHGVIYPISFVISLFTKNVNVYEVHNNGGWYNFGFVLGIAVLHSVFAAPARASRRRQQGGSS